MIRILHALAGACALVACTSPTASLQPLPAATDAPYQLGAGDEVRVVVQGFDAMSNTYVVADTGAISMPLVGQVPASGKTTAELEGTVAAQLVARELAVNPSVNVQVHRYRPFFILGEVQKPGQYAYVPGMSVLTAVSIAGGHTFRADTKAYGVSRTINGTITKGKGDQNTPVRPGDTVIVYEAWF